MNVKVEPGGPCRRILHIEVPKDRVAAEYARVAGMYAREAHIRGFRPGRVPLDIVERHYAKQIVQDTRDRLVPTCYREALRQQKLTPVAVVNVRDEALAKDRDFVFDVVLDVPPDFTLPEYRTITLQSRAVEVTESNVDTALERLRENLARFQDVTDRPAREGDLVRIDFQGTIEGQPVGRISAEAAPLGEGQDFWMAAGKSEEDFVPGLAEGIVGAPIGERREIRVVFPEGHRVPGLAGRTAVYAVTLKGMREKILPPVDAEFLAALRAESEAALRDRLRAGLKEAAAAAETRRLKGEIVRHLLERTRIEDLPQSLVQSETRRAVQDIVYENMMRGATREQIHERKDDIVGAATQSSGERVKVTYILRRIADEVGVAVDDGELNRRIEAMAAPHRMPPERMRAELEKRDALDDVREDLRLEKTLDYLVANANITAA
jgi:trigger factor